MCDMVMPRIRGYVESDGELSLHVHSFVYGAYYHKPCL